MANVVYVRTKRLGYDKSQKVYSSNPIQSSSLKS